MQIESFLSERNIHECKSTKNMAETAKIQGQILVKIQNNEMHVEKIRSFVEQIKRVNPVSN